MIFKLLLITRQKCMPWPPYRVVLRELWMVAPRMAWAWRPSLMGEQQGRTRDPSGSLDGRSPRHVYFGCSKVYPARRPSITGPWPPSRPTLNFSKVECERYPLPMTRPGPHLAGLSPTPRGEVCGTDLSVDGRARWAAAKEDACAPRLPGCLPGWLLAAGWPAPPIHFLSACLPPCICNPAHLITAVTPPSHSKGTQSNRRASRPQSAAVKGAGLVTAAGPFIGHSVTATRSTTEEAALCRTPGAPGEVAGQPRRQHGLGRGAGTQM
ncbi:hypothetical protein E2C01_020690 [Portunus trituberculatus]|uniref:Uncharacterized protein n=1 Tax=Portunus trituberculatus TaxID=210409 RepID=A0A5B7E0U8_PORTR|nr:hypothetical protein [Portunus trituberculatus]